MKQENNKMRTPISDFVKKYAKSNSCRFHMPGHKGKSFVGCEEFDITEIGGADSLYEADGIIAESEKNASELFGTARTLFSTEGSSQCIRAMLYLVMLCKKEDVRPVIVATRNVHKAFIYAATLLDFDVIWLWPEGNAKSICSCYVSPETIEKVLQENKNSVVAVYITSPDYLGTQLDIEKIAEVCHRNGTILTVDNAHGAYLRFLKPSIHPIDLGADICCDSAHKTLPVLTGGAYLHISKNAPNMFAEQAKYAMGLFGSTSPSYLILTSLDLCNAYLAANYKERLKEIIDLKETYVNFLKVAGWKVCESDPLKLTIELPKNLYCDSLIEKLRQNRVEYEYADFDFIVFMLTPENTEDDFKQIIFALGKNVFKYEPKDPILSVSPMQKITIREAMFATPEAVSVENALGRICRVPTVSCPPAIPLAVPGELIDEGVLKLFEYYGMKKVDVVKSLDQ